MSTEKQLAYWKSKKGKSPWNKGLTKKTDDRVKKNAEVKIGKKYPNISKAKMGHKVTEKTREKIRKWNKENPSEPFKGKKHTTASKKKMSDTILKGFENGRVVHNKGKGNKSTLQNKVRELKKYIVWRTTIFERDNWTCQTCRNRGNVIAHHIKFFAIILDEYKVLNIEDAEKCKELWDINNGVTLCPECHKIVHKKIV